MEKRFEILDLPPDARPLVAECEVSGARTIFERNGRPVAILVSWDEYLALRETLEVGNDAALRAQIVRAEQEVGRGAIVVVEEMMDEE
ncbi:MAG TPA: type II toxin-antitoxin system prevent-host-death family antitoxin [Thermoanaerobaculia bacterium]|jgi:PHD/YefM family antitoxin component YafN of YafNO toxin-antitoxin module|nr:type II toxin-antitoxin system prevent-host-death family antitoxin [Thermoanaerobaculia bacterium]